jgi:signal transduction histidine kinase
MPTAGEVLQYFWISFGGAHCPDLRARWSAYILTGRTLVVCKFIIGVSSAGVLLLSSTAFAQENKLGTADEAKAMLLKAVVAVKADKEVALAMFNKGEGGFRDRDLYPFCFRLADGKYVANPALTVIAGTDTHTLKDPTGKVFGEELYAGAQKPEGQITEVRYMFPKPGTTAPAVPKVSFVTRVADLGCGVGYYK